MENLELRGDDGVTIAARRFTPAGAPRAAVLIAGAMGVRQDYYAPFAEWLAGQGYLVQTFDYRGMGESRPASARRSLRGFQADLFDWGRDYDTAIDSITGALPGLPLYVVGHSLGAQMP